MNDLKERYINAKRRLFDKAYSHLNPPQREAVFTANGPLLVLAGAGSGKTTVLVNRIVYLIKYGNAYFSEEAPEDVDKTLVEALEYAEGMSEEEILAILPQFITDPIPPYGVLAITFTNKAAKEIKDRLDSAFDDKAVAESVWAGTFHSMCLRILRKYGERLGYRSGFSIYDTDDKLRMIKDCMRELDISEKQLSPKAVANEISHAKDELIDHEDYKSTSDPRSKDIAAIYKLYHKKMMANNAVDFDDIIMQTVRLLEGEPDVLSYYSKKFRHVLVDEYQDTNHAQFVLTRLLASGYENVMVVGDDDQSIYRFRGATVENILDFDKTYPNAKVVKLEQNYRSTENILSAANSIIKNNDRRHAKKLWCDKGKGELITLYEAADQNDEGRHVIEKINRQVKDEGRKYSDFAVLYRTNALGRALQTVFAKSATPYKVVGDTSFYERKEIKDMIAYLSVIASGEDNLRLKRVINEPKRKIGPAAVEALEKIAERESISMLEAARRCEEFPVLSKLAPKLKSFVGLIDEIRASDASPSEKLREVYIRSGYQDMLVGEGFEGEGKIELVEELINGTVEFEKRMEAQDKPATLEEYLEELLLVSSVDKYDESADAVVLMTVHAAKGLEFPVVFIVGMEDGIFPSEQSRGEPDGINEERRLAYVAITRAKERLYISHVHDRLMYGKSCMNPLSTFVRRELPEALILREGRRLEPARARSEANFFFKRPTSAPSGEFRRAPAISAERPSAREKGASPESFGVVRIPDGARVSHAMFGEGEILSSKDLGGDILYEVKFDSGATKKLMATFAKLKKL